MPQARCSEWRPLRLQLASFESVQIYFSHSAIVVPVDGTLLDIFASGSPGRNTDFDLQNTTAFATNLDTYGRADLSAALSAEPERSVNLLRFDIVSTGYVCNLDTFYSSLFQYQQLLVVGPITPTLDARQNFRAIPIHLR